MDRHDEGWGPSNEKLINVVIVVCWMSGWCGLVMMVGDREGDTYDYQRTES